MQRSVRHFVRRILGIHLLLLALLLAVVSGAARHVYHSARVEAMQQAKVNQQLLASQTAKGIGGFYNSILSDLRLLKPDPADEAAEASDALAPQPIEVKPFAGLGLVRQAAGAMLAQQLQGRAHLFVVDEQMHPHQIGTEEHPLKQLNHPGKRPLPTSSPSTKPAAPPLTSFEQEAREIITNFSPWLSDMYDAAISPMKIIGGHSIKLVCVPLYNSQRSVTGKSITRRTGWLVAVVRALHIEDEFLADLNTHDVSGAFLVDESMTIMAASPHDLIGTRLDENDTDPRVAGFISDLKQAKFNATGTLTKSFHIGDQGFEPAMLSAFPVKEILGKQWFVVVASPLKDVDGIVRELSSKALFWAIFVAISMTAILVSTATQLILSRMRMERVRHQSLQNEMRQARQIQLAWLPQKTKTMCSSSLIDIASLNRPATHISGDFYNFFELPDGRTAVVIGDVTGHGMAAAFLMATTQLLVRNTLPQYCDPGRCLEDVNRQLTNQVFNGQFVTMQVLVIDSRSGEVAIATAGHPAPLISDGESFQSVRLEPQLVAGVDPKTQYPTERFRLRPGSSILLYTDGVVETEDATGQHLRLDDLRAALKGKVENAEALLQRAVSAVNTFRRGVDLHDDLTMVAIHFLPQPRVLPPALPSPTGSAKALPAVRVSR